MKDILQNARLRPDPIGKKTRMGCFTKVWVILNGKCVTTKANNAHKKLLFTASLIIFRNFKLNNSYENFDFKIATFHAQSRCK